MSQINITSGPTYIRDANGKITVTGKRESTDVTVTLQLDTGSTPAGVAGTGLMKNWTQQIAASVGTHKLSVSGGNVKELIQAITVVEANHE